MESENKPSVYISSKDLLSYSKMENGLLVFVCKNATIINKDNKNEKY